MEGFLHEVECSWGKPVAATCPLQLLSIKLGRLSRDLQSWSQNKLGSVKLQLGYAKEIIHRLEIAQDSRELSNEEDGLGANSRDMYWP